MSDPLHPIVIDRLVDLADAAGGRVEVSSGSRSTAESVAISRVMFDSRSVEAGDLFVALVADRDGHEFASDAIERGASAALVSREVDLDAPRILVEDTIDALSRLGAAARLRLSGPVIGVTGSVGKTSTKDLLEAICRRAGVTSASAKSLNNELGVPLTLVNARRDTERTIIEMGARGAGHIAHLCSIAAPTHAVVTAVGMAHTELFGSLEAVAEAKSELVRALPTNGVAVLNASDPHVVAMAALTDASVLTFGAGGDVVAENVTLGDDLRASFTLHSDWGSAAVTLGVSGAHNVSNALGAAGAALVTGVPLAEVAAGLGDAVLSPSRMALHTLPEGGRLLDDAYNANPTSMRAALDALAALDASRRVAVLGYMGELGEDADEQHRLVAVKARELGIEVVAIGTDLYGTEPFGDVAEAIRTLPRPSRGEAVLVKASRSAGLERLVDAWLRQDPQKG